MKRAILIIGILFLLAGTLARAQTGAARGWCEDGNVKVVLQGMSSTNTVQGSYPRCSVKVFLTGTTTLATIYSDGISTPLSNPFTASANGAWLFFASTMDQYDVVLSGGTPIALPAPVPLSAVSVGGGAGGGVVSLNSLVGALNLAAGPNMTVAPSGTTITLTPHMYFPGTPTVTVSGAVTIGDALVATSSSAGDWEPVCRLNYNGDTQSNICGDGNVVGTTLPAAPAFVQIFGPDNLTDSTLDLTIGSPINIFGWDNFIDAATSPGNQSVFDAFGDDNGQECLGNNLFFFGIDNCLESGVSNANSEFSLFGDGNVRQATGTGYTAMGDNNFDDQFGGQYAITGNNNVAYGRQNYSTSVGNSFIGFTASSENSGVGDRNGFQDSNVSPSLDETAFLGDQNGYDSSGMYIGGVGSLNVQYLLSGSHDVYAMGRGAGPAHNVVAVNDLALMGTNDASNEATIGNSSMTKLEIYGSGDGCLGSTSGVVVGVGGGCKFTLGSTLINMGDTVTSVTGLNTTGQAGRAVNLTGGVLGSIPYQTAANTTAYLGPNTSTGVEFLTMTGTGSAGTAPVWTPLGTAAFDNTGTSGATIPLLNGANHWSSTQSFQGATAVELDMASGGVISWNSDTGLSRASAGVIKLGNGTAGDASGTLDAANGAFSAALTVAGNAVCQSTGTNCPTMPLYNSSGTIQSLAHAVIGSGTMTAGTLSVTFSGSAAYSSSGSYSCTANDGNAASAIHVFPINGSSISFIGTAGDTVIYACIGN